MVTKRTGWNAALVACWLLASRHGAAQMPAAGPSVGQERGPGPAASADELPLLSLLFRGGSVLGGPARDSVSCKGEGCVAASSGSDAFAHQPALVLGAAFLWQPARWIRFGPSLLYTPGQTLDYGAGPAASEAEFGSMLSFDIVGDVPVRLGRSFWLLPIAEVGLAVVSPSDRFEGYMDQQSADCRAGNRVRGCGSLEGPYVGLNAGIGIGGLLGVSEAVRLRSDLVLQAYEIALANLEVIDGSTEIRERLFGARVVLVGGVEMGL